MVFAEEPRLPVSTGAVSSFAGSSLGIGESPDCFEKLNRLPKCLGYLASIFPVHR